jgi:RNA polymerase sigma-70 factor (ECF subfamily)
MADAITEAEFKRIYRETVKPLYAYVARRCRADRQLAEDVTQEVWLRAVREWHRGGAPRNPIAWLITVARRLLINQGRRVAPLALDDVSAAEIMAAVDSEGATASRGIATLVGDAIARLSSADAELIESVHYDRCTASQLAELEGISERTVERRLRKARERLRRELEITLRAERGLV